MKAGVSFLFSLVPLFLNVGGASAAVAACNANNCLRALRATNMPSRSAAADCSAYVVQTITPEAVTKTIVDTITVTDEATVTTTTRARVIITTFEVFEKRSHLAIPTIPAYASACSNPARYSSACACIGVTAAVVTAPAPVETTTASVTATVSTTTTSTFSTTTSRIQTVYVI